MNLPEYRRFGDYTLLGEIARGGMGVVYQAVHSRLNRPCALKLIRAGALASAAERARFLAEAEAAAGMDHPHIVRVRQAGEAEGQLFLELELVEGGTLADQLAAGPLPAREAAALVAQLARAVQHAHARGVLHRDLKPANVLLAPNGAPRLTDFGLARLLDRESGLTRTVALLGTPAYLAPELAEGRARAATTAADVYGLGAILYEALAGRPAYAGETPLAVLHAVQAGPPPPPSRVRPGVPRDLEILVLRAMHRVPAGRFPAAGELADELERWLRGEPVRSHPAPWWEEVRAWARRRPAVAALSAALAVVVVAALVLMDQQRRAARELSGSLRRQLSTVEVARAADDFRNRRSHRGLATLAGVLRQDPLNASATRHLAARLRDYAWPRPVFQLDTGGHEVRAAAASPDGTTIVTGSADGKVRTWSTADGAVLEPSWQTEGGLWQRLAHDESGRWLLSLTRQGRLQVWPASGGAAVFEAGSAGQPVHEAFFLPGRESLVLAQQGHPARLVTLAPVAETNALPEESRDSQALGYDAASGTLAVAGARPVVRLWQLEQRRWLAPIALPAPAVGLSFGKAGRLLAVATPSELLVYRVADGQELVREARHAVFPARFDPSGSALFFANGHAQLAVLAGGTQRPREMPDHVSAPLWGLVFSDDGGRLLLDSGHRGAQAFTLAAADGLARLGEPIPQAWGNDTALFLKDSGRVLLAGGSQPATVWETRLMHPHGQACRLGNDILAAGFTADSRELRLLLADGRLRVVPLPFSSLPEPAALGETPLDAAVFSSDATLVATVRGAAVEVWQVSPPRRLHALPPASAGAGPVAFSPDGRVLAVGADDASLRLWDVAEGRLRGAPLELRRQEPGGSGAALLSLEFSADGRLLAAAGQTHLAHVVEASSSRILMCADHRAPVARALVLPGNRRLATASMSGNAQVWDLASGQPTGPPLTHASPILDMDASDDGRRLATAGADRTVRVWDVERGVLVSRFSAGYAVGRVRFLAGGQALLSTTQPGHAQVHEAETALYLTRRAELGIVPRGLTLSRDRRWAAIHASRGEGRLLCAALPDTPAPPWAAELAEALAGERLRPGGEVELVPPAEFLRLQPRLRRLRGDDFWHGHLLPGLLEP